MMKITVEVRSDDDPVSFMNTCTLVANLLIRLATKAVEDRDCAQFRATRHPVRALNDDDQLETLGDVVISDLDYARRG